MHSTEHYYRTRSEIPTTSVERAARVIYLNKTCFNGLYRENSRGEFNVPMGNYVNPAICDVRNLRACALALATTTIEQQPFEAVLDSVRAGDLVYFDPPYVPLSATSSFTSYAKDGFGMEDQQRLATLMKALDHRGVFVILSNSKTPVVEQLYGQFHRVEVPAKRAINSNGARRGEILEVIVTNFR